MAQTEVLESSRTRFIAWHHKLLLEMLVQVIFFSEPCLSLKKYISFHFLEFYINFI